MICHSIITVGDYIITKQQLCTALQLHISIEQFQNFIYKVQHLISKFTEMGDKNKKEDIGRICSKYKGNDKQI